MLDDLIYAERDYSNYSGKGIRFSAEYEREFSFATLSKRRVGIILTRERILLRNNIKFSRENIA